MTEITGIEQAQATQVSRPENRLPGQEFDSDLFLQLLVTQLRYQDPMSESQDTGDMITQLTMFTLLEQVVNLQSAVEEQSETLDRQHALGLLNQQVEVAGPGGEQVAGVVSAVEFRSAGPYITVNEHDYPLSSLMRVTGGGAENG